MFSRVLVTATAATALALLPLAGSAQATENTPPAPPASVAAVSGEQRAASTSCSVSNDQGYARLNSTNSSAVGKYDYVALYDRDPWHAGANGYLWGAWQWVTSGDYTTNRSMNGTKYWCAYVSYDYAAGHYKILSTGGPVS
ncbi:hypothetical protein ACFVIM_29020 [Streptomyces sp. NPDC057638]|uniref:hypothetical protein n=1 Tax=Streptomyces sp. NPDC057638 TaxID=3346190 RepID=UPI0036A37BB9